MCMYATNLKLQSKSKFIEHPNNKKYVTKNE
jgi:hypothetical protein